jgi:hypothetical protein
MLVPIMEFDFNPIWPTPGGGASTTNAPPLQFYSISKQVQPFLIILLTLGLSLLVLLPRVT